MSYPRIFSKVFNEPALLTGAAHRAIQATLLSHLEGGNLFDVRRDPDRSVRVKGKQYKLIEGDTALVEVSGVIARRLSMIEDACGMYEQTHITEAIKAAVRDDRVKQVMVDFDTPGGSVTGTFESGRMIRELDKEKPVFAYTETLCASAGYWLASQCRGIIAAPSATVGSIGVYVAWLIEDAEIELIKSGRYKAMGIQPLSEEERGIIQASVDKIHAQFKEEVRFNRKELKDEIMEGLTYDGAEAEENGLVDALAMNFDEALEMIKS